MKVKKQFSFQGTINQFPGKSAWYYIDVPDSCTEDLKSQRRMWGMYPIEVQVGNTIWQTKLMMKKGGHFFIALKSEIRKKEDLFVGDLILISFDLI